MTEQEAKTRWCPFARTLVTIRDAQQQPIALTSANQFEGNAKATCLGSACMAWRWKLEVYPNDPEDGWCGLAGNPKDQPYRQ